MSYPIEAERAVKQLILDALEEELPNLVEARVKLIARNIFLKIALIQNENSDPATVKAEIEKFLLEYLER